MSSLNLGQNSNNQTGGSEQQGGGLFGNMGSNTGGGAAPGGGTTGGIFGVGGSGTQSSSNPQLHPSSGGTGNGIFGGGNSTSAFSATNPLKPSAGGSGIFGSSGGTTSNSNAWPSASPGGPFGGVSGSSQQSTPGVSNPLFGGTSSTQPAQSSNTLSGGQNSTNSADTPFGGSKPQVADQGTAATSKPASSNFFAKPPATGTSGPTAPAGGLFSSVSKPTDNPSTSSGNATPAGGFFGGGLFGKKLDDATPAASSVAGAAPGPSLFGTNDASASKDATPAVSTGGLFGNLNANKDKAAESKGSTTCTFGDGLFGSKNTTGEKKDVTVPSAFSLGNVNSGEKEKSTAGAPVAVPPPSMLRGKTIEDIVNRWASELDNHVREFNKFAGEVAVWDRALIENGNNLAALYSHVLAAEREQTDIDQSLDHIEQQQRDLSATLDTYEKSAEEILGSQGGGLRALDTGPADTERDKNYMLATDLHTHLDDLSASLTQMIESVNAFSKTPIHSSSPQNLSEAEDPVTQIAQILGNHLESLQWIDGAVREVEGKVTEVEKRVKESGVGNGGLNGGAKSRGFGTRGED